MSGWLAQRINQPELFDDHDPPADVVARMFTFLTAVNRHLGGVSATLARFETFSRTWRPGERIEVLDIASGAADMSRALVAWGRRRGFDLRVTAMDRSQAAVDYARQQGPPDARLRLVRADVTRSCWRPRAFDYVTSALFAHHLSNPEVVDLLRLAGRLARRGVVVNDLVRSRQAYLLTWLLTWPFDPILHHDGPLSVRRSLTPDEMVHLASEAEMPWLTVARHFGGRMTLAGERPTTAPDTEIQ